MASVVSQILTSTTLTSLERAWSRLIGDFDVVHFYHCPIDAHSHATLIALQELAARPDFNKTLSVHIVSEQKGYEAESPEQQWQWAKQDAQWALLPYLDLLPLARSFKPSLSLQLSSEAKIATLVDAVRIASNENLAVVDKVSALLSLGQDVFAGNAPGSLESKLPADVQAILSACERDLHAGHYLAGMVRLGREWFWGVDRLSHLERALGLPHCKFDRNRLSRPLPRIQCAQGVKLQVFYSFRSPYSQLAVRGLLALREAGVAIEVCNVLPMVMRGLQVPLQKRLYIVRDAAREARELGIPFGKISDPVGLPTERAFVALHFAREAGRELELMDAWANAVWACGVNAGTDAGLEFICVAAGLEWNRVRAGLSDSSVEEQWRARAEANRSKLYQAGLWGVPSFRIVDSSGKALCPAVWGQDRLFVVETQLLGLSGVGGVVGSSGKERSQL